MVKSSSLILIGTGIFIAYAYLALSVYAIVVFTEDDTALRQIWNISSPLTIDNLSENVVGFTSLMLVLLGFVGMGLGILLLLIGGAKFVNEKRKSQEITIEQKRVSIIWQVVGSFFPGFDLWVLYRIKKLRNGSIAYASQFAIWLGLDFLELNLVTPVDGFLVSIGYAVVVFIFSRQWNKQFSENIVTNELK